MGKDFWTESELRKAMLEVLFESSSGDLKDIELTACYAHAFKLLMNKLTNPGGEKSDAE